MQPVNLLLLGLLAGTQYALWFGDKNVFDLYQLEQTAEQTRQQNQDHAERNQRLLSEVVDLKSGGETVETIARTDLGLIKGGETFYQIIEE